MIKENNLRKWFSLGQWQTMNKKTVKYPLLKNMMGASTAEKVVSSVQHLEYAIADAINKVTKDKEKKVAIIKGNGEMHELLIADFLKTDTRKLLYWSIYIGFCCQKPATNTCNLKKL